MKALEHAFTSKYWSWTYLDPVTCPPTLEQALNEKLDHIPAHTWPTRFKLGGVYVNGVPAQPGSSLTAPCKLEYYEPKFDVEQAAAFFPKITASDILFEDQDIIVVFKPAGLSSMPARDQSVFHLKAQLEEYCGRVIHMPSRIDMSAQGLVIVSTSERMHKHLQHAFQFRRIEKRYLLRVCKQPVWQEHTLEAPIGRDPEHPVLRMVSGKGALPSLTYFRAVHAYADGTSLLEASPHTGRTHQIRVHAAFLGLPIVGDKFYGGGGSEILNLLSFRLRITHPFTKQALDIRVPDRLLPPWVEHEKLELPH